MSDAVRPYLFYDVAVSISTCYRKVEGKIIFQDNCVYVTKWCPAHGSERVLMADDVDYYPRCREILIKRPEMPRTFNTPVRWRCPYDCGLCADHQQHSCLSLIEITDHCNLQCPVCYAQSGPTRQEHKTLSTSSGSSTPWSGWQQSLPCNTFERFGLPLPSSQVRSNRPPSWQHCGVSSPVK